jgi:hypothetical protein
MRNPNPALCFFVPVYVSRVAAGGLVLVSHLIEIAYTCIGLLCGARFAFYFRPKPKTGNRQALTFLL